MYQRSQWTSLVYECLQTVAKYIDGERAYRLDLSTSSSSENAARHGYLTVSTYFSRYVYSINQINSETPWKITSQIFNKCCHTKILTKSAIMAPSMDAAIHLVNAWARHTRGHRVPGWVDESRVYNNTSWSMVVEVHPGSLGRRSES